MIQTEIDTLNQRGVKATYDFDHNVVTLPTYKIGVEFRNATLVGFTKTNLNGSFGEGDFVTLSFIEGRYRIYSRNENEYFSETLDVDLINKVFERVYRIKLR